MLLLEATALTLAGSGIKVAKPQLILPSPSPHLLRAVSPGSSTCGLVGWILVFDPKLHCGGPGGPKLGEASGRAHLEAVSSDWWADCVEMELAGPSRSAPSSDEEHSDHARTPSKVPSQPMALSPVGTAAAMALAPVSPSVVSQLLQS